MESKFDGGLLGLIGVNLLTCLVSLITLTIAVPWMGLLQREVDFPTYRNRRSQTYV